jgi:1-acyl-sn-glycerol-3-phosphate acyltransferase
MSSLARLLTRTFFRQVEVEHGERIVSGRPTVVVADHRNALVDGLLLMGALRRYPHFMGKSTLFHNPLLWPFLRLGGVVPVYRAQDGGSPEGNRRAFARCHRLLERGGMVAVFPEGISHDEPSLQPLRTGAARIALSAAAAGVPDVETVAVALVYDDKQRFRSRALVRVGIPVATGPQVAEYRADEHATVRALTADLAERLRHVGREYASWAEADRLAAIAEMVVRPTTVLPGAASMAEREDVVDRLIEVVREPARRAEVATLESAYAAYTALLGGLGLTDAQVAADYGSGHLRRDLGRAVAKVVVALPIALAGLAVHAVPYGLVKVASGLPANVGVRATVKVVGSFFLYTVAYVVVGVLVGTAVGPGWGLLAAVAAPVCGAVALRMVERIQRMGGAIAGYRAVRSGGPVAGILRSRRAAVLVAARHLLGTRIRSGP